MQYRVQSIKDEFTKLSIKYDNLKRDALFLKIVSVFTKPQSGNNIKTIPIQKTVVQDIIEESIEDEKGIINEGIEDEKDIFDGLSEDEKINYCKKT